MKNNTVLVTGAAGFLGSHISLHHLKKGDVVLGIDDFSSSNEESGHLRDLKSFKKKFKLLKADISHLGDISDIAEWLNKQGVGDVDVVYNFACPASPPVYQKMPVHTMMTCVAGTKNVFDIARLHNSVVVHASTSEIYGDPDVSPQAESYKGNVNSYGPRACYDEGKRAAEALCYDYLHKHNLDVRLVRIFNTYGPHMDPNDGRVVSNFIVQALKGEPLTIYGHGSQTRSFCYVDDLIRGITTLASLPSNPLTPINLGNPNEFTIVELAELVNRKIVGTKMLQKHSAMPIDDPRQRRPDITIARDLLKWEPEVALSDGLDRTIEYFRKVI